MMDDVINNWFEDFDDDVSCYMYLSFVGKDWFFCSLTFLIQWFTPIVLGLSSLQAHTEAVGADDEEGYGRNSEYFCTRRDGDNVAYAKVTLVAVMLYYAMKVVPDQVSQIKVGW